MHYLASLSIAALAGAASAQTFIVDAANGPGTNFIDLPTAVATVPDGAVLLVRPGSYSGFTIYSKGLTVLGSPGALITGTASISGTNALQPVTLRGLTWHQPLTTSYVLVLVSSCAGQVTLEDLTVPQNWTCQPWPYPGINCPFYVGVEGFHCDRLVLRNCSVQSGVWLDSSTASIDSCQIRGNDATPQYPPRNGAPGLLQTSGETTASGSTTIEGGSSHALFGPLQAGAGIEMRGGTLRVLDGTVIAGTVLGATTQPAPTIDTTWATSLPRISPRVTLQGSRGPLVGTDIMPQLTGAGAAPGGILTASVATEPGDLAVLAVGLPGAPLTTPGFLDPFWLDPNAHVFIAIGMHQPATPITGAVAVPNNPAFIGGVLIWQAACQGPITGLQATNPVVTLVH